MTKELTEDAMRAALKTTYAVGLSINDSDKTRAALKRAIREYDSEAVPICLPPSGRWATNFTNTPNDPCLHRTVRYEEIERLQSVFGEPDTLCVPARIGNTPLSCRPGGAS